MANDVVLIQLDRQRVLRYGHKALKMLNAMTGHDISSLDEDSMDIEMLEKVIYCGLLSDAKMNGEVLKLEDMEDLLDLAPNYKHVIDAMNKALKVAFGTAEIETKN